MKSLKPESFQKQVNIPDMEKEVLDFWEETHAFEKSVEQRPKTNPYHFYDGPPFATGLPHYGHIVASLIKDVVPRFWTMKGYRVERKWGWDCHGLPIENIIEKELHLKTKQDIERFGIGKFNEACRATVLKYVEEWKKTVRRMGRWVDMEHDYKTMDLPYMESVWWVFRQLWDQGLIYKGHKAMHICPRCVTPLSNFEVTQGYKDITDQTVIVKFPVKNAKKTLGIDGTVSMLAWTTTPWTLPGNLLLAVHPDHSYAVVKLKDDDALYILAEATLEKVLDTPSYTVVKLFTGKELGAMNLTYEPAFPYFQDTKNAFRVVTGDFVTLDEGTGIVHIAPAFGENDYALGMREGLPIVQHVTMEGAFTPAVVDFAGKPVKSKDDPSKTDKELLVWLTEKGKVFKQEPVTHSYPHCWRCETPLINYATTSWFVKVTHIKEQLLANNRTIRWVPEHMKEGRFGQWLEGARDWAVSRNRYWGTPLPIWESEDGDIICVGSVKELEDLSGKKVTDLHKHTIDDIMLTKDGKAYKRIPEVLDCWFESGSMPYGQMHYPFEHKEEFERSFPAQFIAEGQDQTRGWFYTLHVLSTALTMGINAPIGNGTSTPAFLNVIVNGIVLSGDGKKMSKRLKNYPDPDVMIDRYGADAMRYYLATSPVMESESLNFSESGVREVYNKVINTLWNVLAFYNLYGTKGKKDQKSTHVLDRWILSRLHHMVASVTSGMEAYQLADASRPIAEFIGELSQWYVRRSRERLKGDGIDGAAASQTLQEVLVTTAKVIAPFMPFIAELVYQNVQSVAESVHICDWPASDTTLIDDELEASMKVAREMVEKIHAKRKELKIPVRQPLGKCQMSLPAGRQEMSNELIELIKEETNIKTIEFIKGEGEIQIELDTTITPELEQEGKVREVVRKIQKLRKDKGCAIDEKITLTLPSALQTLGDSYLESIKWETLSDTILWGDSFIISTYR